jgi:hypothetical protein
MSLNREASPGTPGAGYQDTNDRDIRAKQGEAVSESEANRDESIALDQVRVLPGTGGPDDSGDEAVPVDYDRTGHSSPGKEKDAAAGDPARVDPAIVTKDSAPVENPSG